MTTRPVLTPNDTEFAGEYVLRVLPDDAHRAAATRAADDPAFASEIRKWENHLVALTDEIMPVSPSAAAKAAMMDLLFGVDAKPTLFERVGTWKTISALLIVTTMTMAVLVFMAALGR